MICEFGSLTFDKLATVVFKCRIKYDLQRVTSHCHCIFNNYVNKARFYARSSVDRFQLFWQNVHWTGFTSMHDFSFEQTISDTKRLETGTKVASKWWRRKELLQEALLSSVWNFQFIRSVKHIFCAFSRRFRGLLSLKWFITRQEQCTCVKEIIGQGCDKRYVTSQTIHMKCKDTQQDASCELKAYKNRK